MEAPELFDFSDDVPDFDRMLSWIHMEEEYLYYLQHEEYEHLHEKGGLKSDERYLEIKHLKSLYEGDVLSLRAAINHHYPGRSLNPVGRPKKGVRRQVKMTLPAEDWYRIETAVLSGSASSIADYFRQLHERSREI